MGLAPPSVDGAKELKIKICLVGTPGVGKTSLTRRFVYDTFSEKYLYTVGANMSKKVLDLTPPGTDERWSVVLIVWDIMGERTFLDLVKEAYFRGASGVVAVADLTRPETFGEFDTWIHAVKEVAGADVPVVIFANKVDLVDFQTLDWSPLATSAAQHAAPLLPTSAKSGENVENPFLLIGQLALVTVLRKEARREEAPTA